MATSIITDLVPFLRLSIDDNSQPYEFTDTELETYLRFGVAIQEGSWNQSYSIILDTTYKINPDPPEWLKMLYVIKTTIMIRTFQERFSYNNKVLAVTRTSKTEDLRALQMLYDEIINERKNSCVGYSYNSFDDYFTRFYDIVDEINEGFR
jgi:hypothetical protein